MAKNRKRVAAGKKAWETRMSQQQSPYKSSSRRSKSRSSRRASSRRASSRRASSRRASSRKILAILKKISVDSVLARVPSSRTRRRRERWNKTRRCNYARNRAVFWRKEAETRC